HVIVKLVTHRVELAALLSQALQFLGAPVVEGYVAGAVDRARAAAAVGEHAVGGAVDLVLEVAEPITPEDVGQHCEPKRPVSDEAEDHQSDSSRRPGGTEH